MIKKEILSIYILVIVLLISQNTSAQSISDNYYLSYFGGSDTEWGEAIAVDNSGCVYFSGRINSTDLPINHTLSSAGNGFITKLSPDMTQIIYCAYVEGVINNLYVDKDNNLYAIGSTESADFPCTDNAYDKTYNGNEDILILKLDPQGELLYGTCFGGSGREKVHGFHIDDALNLYCAGFTNSTDFPVKSAYSDTYNGGDGGLYGYSGDAYAMKFDLANNELIFSTYLGGSDNEVAYGLAVDKDQNVYVTGETPSSNFPVKNGFQLNYKGNTDGFITKLSVDGKDIIYSSFFGGNGADGLSAIAVNDNNEAYIIGGTKSSGLYCSENAFYSNRIGGEDIFIIKVSALGNELNYASYFGGSNSDYGRLNSPVIKLVDNSTIIFASNTQSTNLPVTVNAFDPDYAGGSTYGDILISKLNLDTKENIYTSYIGSSGDEGSHLDIFTNDNCTIYLCSFTSSKDLNTSSDALFKTSPGGYNDAFIMRLQIDIPTGIGSNKLDKSIKIGPNPTKNQLNIQLNNSSSAKTNYELRNIHGTKIKSGQINSSFTLSMAGLYPGVYFINIEANNEKICRKIIKQ